MLPVLLFDVLKECGAGDCVVVSRFSFRFRLIFLTDSATLPPLTEDKADHITLFIGCILLETETNRFATEIAPQTIRPFSGPYAFEMGRVWLRLNYILKFLIELASFSKGSHAVDIDAHEAIALIRRPVLSTTMMNETTLIGYIGLVKCNFDDRECCYKL